MSIEIACTLLAVYPNPVESPVLFRRLLRNEQSAMGSKMVACDRACACSSWIGNGFLC